MGRRRVEGNFFYSNHRIRNSYEVTYNLGRPGSISKLTWFLKLVAVLYIQSDPYSKYNRLSFVLSITTIFQTFVLPRIFSCRFTSGRNGKILGWHTEIITQKTKSRLVETFSSSCGFLERILSTRKDPETARMQISSCEFFAMELC